MATVELLLMGGPESEPGKDANRLSNQVALAQKKILDHLLMLGVESQWASVAVRCLALRCIGNLVARNPQNLDSLASKLVGEEPHAEPAVNAILRILLRTSIIEEFVAADYVFKCFCEKNTDGQAMLASTMTLQPNSTSQSSLEDDGTLSFGSMLLQALVSSEANEGFEASSRASSVLSHVLKDNAQCKERVLKIVLEAPVPSLGVPEPLLHRIVKHLALAASKKIRENDQTNNSAGDSHIQPIILRLLITWLADCPNAVHCILDSPTHLTYLIELISNPNAGVCVRGFAALVLGECVIYNRSSESGRDAFGVVDAISQKIGLTSFFLNFEDLNKMSLSLTSSPSIQHQKSFTRSTSASVMDMQEFENDGTDHQKHEHPVLLAIFDLSFVSFIKKLEADIRERVVEVFSQTKNKVATVPVELEQKDGEPAGNYIQRLKSFIEKQCHEMQGLLVRNATLADELVKTGGGSSDSGSNKPSSSRERIQSESLRQELEEAARRIEMLKSEKAKIEAEANNYRSLAGKLESDLKSLSDAYNSLEQDNCRLESEVKVLRTGDLEAIKEEAREEAQKESEAELNDLLVCLGQEQSKVEKLSSRLAELGEDIESLLEGIGDDAGLQEEGDDDDEGEDASEEK